MESASGVGGGGWKPWQVVALGLCPLVAAWWVLGRKAPKRKGVRRSMSFTSEAMLSGAWPEAATMPDPIINAVLLFAPGHVPTDERMLVLMKETMVFERFACGTIKADGFFHWKDSAPPTDEELMRHHFFRDKVANETELWQRIETLSPTSLRSNRNGAPIWEMVVVDNANGRSALVLRVHHTIADGISLVNLAQSVLKDEHGNNVTIDLPFKRSNTNKNFGIKLSLLPKVLRSVGVCASLGVSPYDSPLAFCPKDRKSVAFSGKRKLVLFPDMEETFIKAIKNAAKVSFNDVMFAGFAGAVRRYCARLEDPLLSTDEQQQRAIQFRALLPVAFPRSQKESADKTRAMRNKWCFVSAAMPVGGATARDRLEQTNSTMNELKNSPTAPVQLYIQNNLLPYAPRFLARQTVFDIFSRHSMVFSNVPGPKRPFYAAGEQVVGVQMVFPNLIPQVGILSYSGTVFANISVDPEVVTEPALLRRCFVDEFRHLAASYNVPFPDTIAHRQAQLEALEMD